MNMLRLNKTNKILIISASVIITLAFIVTIFAYVLHEDKPVDDTIYTDKLTCKNYFSQLIIDLATKEVKRDKFETTLAHEFQISEEREKTVLSSKDEVINFFSDSSFSIDIKEEMVYITNEFQTKRLIVETDKQIKSDFEPSAKEEIKKGIVLLTYNTYSETKAAYEYFNSSGIKAVVDEVLYIEDVNDVSQTMYGTANEEQEGLSFGLSEMGLDNYKNIIQENRNENEVIVATIGYGVKIEDSFFNDRILDTHYNFIDNTVNIKETIPQGSRVAEVIVNSTTENVKILPIVVVNEEGYSNVSSIVKAIIYSTDNSDVICYEISHKENDMINTVLSDAFKENKPVCCVSSTSEENYPANNPTTIAVSSLDRVKTISGYSGKGDFIDFAASSTDVKEIFDKSQTNLRWSGAQYSNANLVAAIALIKSYDKDFNILEIYNFLRNFCEDLGEKGKDDLYGYGMPNFKELTIANIDKESPEIIDIIYSDENWEKTKKIQIKAKDNIRINAWQNTKDENHPIEWNKVENVTSELEKETEITENGKYYIWVIDTAGNMQNKEIEITKVDNKPPIINPSVDNTTLGEGYVTININAIDEESGLSDLPYSWDGLTWGANSNNLKVTENGNHTIYVKDKMDNISSKEIKISYFANKGTAEIGDGVLIKKIDVSSDWSGDTNNNVQITFNNNVKIVGWQITTNNSQPSYFNAINLNVEENNNSSSRNNTQSNTINSGSITNSIDVTNTTVIIDRSNIVQASSNIEITAKLDINTEYYIWVKDQNGNIYMQTFKIKKVEF